MRLKRILMSIKNVKNLRFLFVFWCLTILFISIYIYFSPPSTTTYHKYDRRKGQYHHSLCLIVPFRDRFDELLEFVPYMYKFLNHQGINHHIIIVNQVDAYRFNRGSLINAGFKFISVNVSECDYIAIHDVDLLPLNNNISYAHPGNDAFHVASPSLHPRYHYRTFIGGILLISRKQFEAVNGLSNRYWGWGMEDDEFYLRLKERKIRVLRPEKLSTNTTNTFRHIHGLKRKRDTARCYNQARVSMKRDRVSGLNDLHYALKGVNVLTIDGCSLLLVNVELNCDRHIAPWCVCK